MRSPLDVVRDLDDALARRDRAALLQLLDPAVTWVQNDGFPEAGVHHGAVHVVDVVLPRFRAEWSAWQAEVREYLSCDDRVVAVGRYQGRHARTGHAVNAGFAHIYTVKDQRIARFEPYTDTHQLIQAMTPPLSGRRFPGHDPAPSLPPQPPRNEFGDPPDRLYTGGTPLFDETGGIRRGRRPK